MKLLGVLCILSGCTGLGFSFARELGQRITELEELKKRMLVLRGEIRYMHQPLPEAFLRTGGNAPEPFRSFFLRTAEDLRLRNGRSAEEIWTANLKRHLCGLHLQAAERRELERLGGMLGGLDVGMQLDVLDYYMEQLECASVQAREAERNRRRLYRYMGALAGAALAVLIV